MYFQQSDLLRGLDKDFVKEFMDIAEKETHKTGYALFREGDRARYFYVLLKGCVKLTIGDSGHTVYTADRSGEVFGWSSLVGRAAYTASAECREATILLRVDVTKLNEILDKDPSTGLIFFKRLAGSLGNRLLQTYRMISSTPEMEMSRSYGTGQVMESEAGVSS
ncbi:MAG: cyclic nucleotide-binding domain-containing protein [Deltaproteobacteria bacterium]|nr:cyclic nucleotide-binding domain-containing protein [Deltaproteobacteria bacterium]